MEREKQVDEIREMAISMGAYPDNCEAFKCNECPLYPCFEYQVSEHFYNAGYRKERQGEWIRRENKSPTQIEAYCSICGRDAVYQVIDNRWQFENYCPHCGARMKGAE